MRRFVVTCLRIILDLGFWLTVLGAAAGGYMAGVRSPDAAGMIGDSATAGIIGAISGLIGGFILACIMFGMFYLLFQIEENTRRGRDFFEALERRMLARETTATNANGADQSAA